MKKRRKFGIFISLIFIILLVFGAGVYAQSYSSYSAGIGSDLQRGSEMLIEWTQGIFGPFLSVFLGGEGDYLFERILFLVIILAVIYVSLSNIPTIKDKKPVVWVITIAVSLIATRFLTESELVMAILLPYGVMGVALTAGIPLIIYFFFVETGFEGHATLRKILWILFIVVFIGLWFSKYSNIGRLSWIYFFTGVCAFLFLLFDGTIQKAILNQRTRDAEASGIYQRIAQVDKTIRELQSSNLPERTKDREIRKKQKERERLYKQL